MTHQDKKLFRINWIMARIKAAAQQDKVAEEKKLIAEVCLKFGAGERYVKEYLKQLEWAGEIRRVGGMIFTPEQYELEKQVNSKPSAQEIINNKEEK